MNRNTLVITQLLMLILITSPLWVTFALNESNGFGAAALLINGGILLLVFLPVCLCLLFLWRKFKRHSIASIVLINIVSVSVSVAGVYTYGVMNEYHRKANPLTWSGENLAEMKTLGVTLAWSKGPWPDSVRLTKLYDRQALSVPSLSFLASFKQLAGDDLVADIEPNSEANYPFKMVFSQLQDNEFVVIPEHLPILTMVGADPHYDAFGEAFVVSTNVRSLFPSKATHIEFWKTTTSKQPVELLLRVPLEKFYAWRRYIQLHLPDLQNSELAISPVETDRTSDRKFAAMPGSPVVKFSSGNPQVQVLSVTRLEEAGGN